MLNEISKHDIATGNEIIKRIEMHNELVEALEELHSKYITENNFDVIFSDKVLDIIAKAKA